MADWTSSEITTLVAPELAPVPAPVFAEFIALVDGQLSLTRFPAGSSRRRWAGMYLTAHLLSLTPPAGVAAAGAPVSSESVGDVSVSYAVGALAPGQLSLTRYGLLFRSLARVATMGGFVA